VRRTRGLWISVIVVATLVVGSLVGLFVGGLSPTLGLDLEGGVSVILSAPSGTTSGVMERALENIRNRVDAFGVGEPDIFLSGTTIEIQIPGAARGTIEQREGEKFCLVGPDGTNYGCADVRATATGALGELDTLAQPTKVCLIDEDGTELACYGSRTEADTAKSTLEIKPKGSASPSPSASTSASASASPSASPSSGPPTGFCLVDSTGKELACFDSSAEAQAAQNEIKSKVAESSFCVVAIPAASRPTPTPSASASPSATPSASAEPSPRASASPSASASASASPSPSPTPQPGYADLDRSGAEPLPCDLKTKDDATTAIAAISVERKTVQYCVVSSGGEDFGCFIDRAAAVRRQQETGQERLLKVIGETARLEERAVLSAVPPNDPSYPSLQVTCGSPEERDTPACSFEALRDKEVVYVDPEGNKYNLGPIVISGDQFTKATALAPNTQQTVSTEWTVSFELNGEGSAVFADATTRALTLPAPQNQIAIIVDRVVISSPTVQGAITGGQGEITGGFTEQSAKDLATQLQAGALPVELTRQSVQTVSPTLGEESLHQGIVAGIVGLVLLFLYMLFYYRLLGVVAWLGMSIWAALAIALVSIAGREFGYALSLAGVAGLVISLGITADSYIVFFERLKDEARSGRSIRSVVQPAFKRAFRTIVAADIVTGIAAAVLYLTAVSSVRGFALTLGVATLLDLFVVYFFKRPTVFLLANNERLVRLRGFGLRSAVAADLPHDEGGVER
jgi:protein-export membrane protein SecD